MKRQNKKVISLLAYRRKKQKQIAKKDERAVGDESGSFPKEGQPQNSKKTGKGTDKIYYMSSYLKSKKLEPLGEESGPPESKLLKENLAKIIRFPSQRRKEAKKPLQREKPPAETVSLQDYRQAKKLKEARGGKGPAAYPMQKAMAVSAMALAAFFAFAVFFQKGGQPIAKNDPPIESENTPPIEGANPLRGLASPQKPEVFFGKRPDSPDYKGF